MKFRFRLENGKRTLDRVFNALGEAMNTEARYLGAPTFCFEAGGCLLDKDGVLEIPEGVDHMALLDKLAEAGSGWSRKRPYRRTLNRRSPPGKGLSSRSPHRISMPVPRITSTNCLPPRVA